MKKFFKQLGLIVLIALIVVIVGIIVKVNSKPKQEEKDTTIVTNKTYSTKYDSNWELIKNSEEKFLLQSQEKAIFQITVEPLKDEFKYRSIEEIQDDLINNIRTQNPRFYLLNTQLEVITEDGLEGLQLLFENEETQVMITLIKEYDKIFVLQYEAESKYFDILLDSADYIIYHFHILPEQFDISSQIEVDTRAISFPKETELDDKMTSVKEYQLARDNYYIKYSLPSFLTLDSFNSTMQSFSYSEDGKYIYVNATYLAQNIYYYLDESRPNSNVFSTYQYIKNNQDSYQNFQENVSEYQMGKYAGFLYKATYDEVRKPNAKHENYVLLIEIGKSGVFKMVINATNLELTEKFFQSIQILEIQNYANYLEQEIANDKIIVQLKRYSNNQKNQLDVVQIEMPDTFQQLDQEKNIYEYRFFGANYDEEKEQYQYEISYRMTSSYLKLESILESINSDMSWNKNNGPIKELVAKGQAKFGEKEFMIYEGEYRGKISTLKGTETYPVYEKVLIYPLELGGNLVIEVKGNNSKIENTLLEEITHFSCNNIENL